jgi:hypothetical protein
MLASFGTVGSFGFYAYVYSLQCLMQHIDEMPFQGSERCCARSYFLFRA